MRLRDALATVIAATLFLDGCATTPNNPAFEAGKAQAQEDIAKGVLAIEQAGWPMRYDQEYVRLLKRKYGIEVRRVADCVVHEDVEGHMRGYNKVAEAEIERRFGMDCLSKAEHQAQTSYEAKTRAR
jgi:hypothetical protein